MPVTVAEFATQRGMSRQGVYNAIKRYEIQTYQGVSNGKSTQFMSDEDAARLNELLGPTESSNLILKQNLELQIRTEREELLKEASSKVEATLREKADEVEKTRTMMLDRIDNGVSEMKQMLESERNGTIKMLEKDNADQKKEIEKLKTENKNLSDENERLRLELKTALEKLKYTQAHPIISALDRKKEAKKNGKPAEDN